MASGQVAVAGKLQCRLTVTDDYHRTRWVWFAVTFTAIWRNFSSAKWRIAGEISKKSRTDVRA